MTTFNSAKYGPILFDASDYTKLIARKGLALDAKRQSGMDNKYPKTPFRLTPSNVLSAALSIQSCGSGWCNLPVILPTVLSGQGFSPITPPSS